jgi:hypothetical protein
MLAYRLILLLKVIAWTVGLAGCINSSIYAESNLNKVSISQHSKLHQPPMIEDKRTISGMKTTKIVLAWNQYSYNILKKKPDAGVESTIIINKQTAGAYFRYRDVYVVHPFYRCANRGVPGVPTQCLQFLDEIIHQFQPQFIVALQSAGIIYGTENDLMKLYAVQSIFFDDQCYPIPNKLETHLDPAVVLYSLSFTKHYEASYCGQSSILLNSNSLSFPLVFKKLPPESQPHVLIIAGVTDLDRQNATLAFDMYEKHKKKIAEKMVDYVEAHFISQ